MTSIRRLALLLLALVAGLGAISMPGRAQGPGVATAPSARFAFADTTLLRDTLGLHFDRLFETADSLGMLPDSLRAHVIRYRLPILRLLAMADSMAVPLDSVGVTIDRERFNPLAAGFATGTQSSFRYTSNYGIGRTNTSWSNGADYTFHRGKMLIRNGTTINMDRSNTTAGLSLRQDRLSRSEVSWKLSPALSVGGVAALSGYDQSDPGSVFDEGERKSEFQFSSHARPKLTRELTSDFSLLSGYLDLKNRSVVKRGLSGDLSSRTRYVRGNWLSYDLSAGAKGNLSRSRRPSSAVTLGTHDLSGTVSGGLQLYQAAPASLNLNYQAAHTSVESATEADTVNRFVTSRASTAGTIRLRVDNNRYLNLTGNIGTSTSLQGVRTDQGSRAEARWTLAPWALDADFSDAVRVSKLPRRNLGGGYNERQDDRQANATLQRPFGRRVTAKLTTSVGLSQYRPKAVDPAATPPTPRDSYRQSYRAEALYNPSAKLSSGVALEVGLLRAINLPAASTSNNTDTRTYRAEWRWNYRLLRGLTATQMNTVQASYQFLPFSPERNQLSLDYSSNTTMTAVLTPRVTVEVSHNARQQPGGEWRIQPDGTGALLPSDENLNYTLRSSVTWTASPGLSFRLAPEYIASDRNGTANGVEVPTSRSRRLNFSGGANLNLAFGKKGQLTGSIDRRFNADRRTTYASGLPQSSPLSQQDFWSGALSFSWEL